MTASIPFFFTFALAKVTNLTFTGYYGLYLLIKVKLKL